MRVFNYSTLKEYWKLYTHSEQQLKLWYTEVLKAEWNNSAELKQQFRTASIINKKRVVFNIKGNDYRLIVDVEFAKKAIFVVWFGTHREYDKIDAEKVSYEE
jgi:mRNA interferase HigB